MKEYLCAKLNDMTRKKGIYDIVFFTTKGKSETTISGANWKQIQDKLNVDYKEFMSVKDEEHTTEPFFKVITSETSAGSSKEKEEYFYTKKK